MGNINISFKQIHMLTNFLKERMRKLKVSVLLSLGISIIFIASAVYLILFVNSNIKNQAIQTAENDAKIILDHNLATHKYFNEILKPAIFKLTDPFRSSDYFDPVWMSSTYAIRGINKSYKKMNNDNYYYKECAVNARSPENEADEIEKNFILEVNQDPFKNFDSQIRKYGDTYYFCTMRRGEIMEAPCLRCHSTPDKAPQELVDQYGPDRSFNRKLGEVIDVISVRVPLDAAYANARYLSTHISAMLLIIFIIIFISHLIIFKLLIGNPLKMLFDQTSLIIENDRHLGIELPLPNTYEFRQLTSTFNKMSYRLRNQIDNLENTVADGVSELKQTEYQLLHAEKLSAIGQLSASIAHEVNNPLQGIMNIIKGVSNRTKFDKNDTELIALALGECNRIRDLIKNLQDFNRPTTGIKELVDIHLAMDTILIFVKKEYKMKQIVIKKEYMKNMPLIRAVNDQIKQVFLNILRNAIEACSNDGIIDIATKYVNNNIIIRIKDNGLGIEPNAIDHIFEPFFSTKSKLSGTGLGLSVCNGIIQSHNGDIKAESKHGKGTTFTITLPNSKDLE